MSGTVIGALRVSLGLDSGPFASGARQATRSLTGLRQNLMAVSAAMAAVAGAAFAMVSATARAANEVARQAAIANSSAQQFQRMAAAAATVGIEQEKLADILKDVNDRVGEFLQTGGGPMADFFDNIAPQVGVTADMFRDLSGPDALQLYVDTLQRAGLSQQDMTFYMEALAGDATALLPLLANNGAELQRLGDAAENSGAIMSDSLIEKSGAFREAMTELQGGITGVKNEIAEVLLPVFTSLVQSINDDVVPVIQQIVKQVGKWVEAFQSLPEPVQDAIQVVATALGVGGPIIIALRALGVALTTFIASTGPVGLFILAFVAVVTALSAWDKDIRKALAPAIEWLDDKLTLIIDTIQSLIDKAIAAKDALMQMISAGTTEQRQAEEAELQENFDWEGNVGVAESAGRAAGNAFAQGVRDGLEIRSPSRVMQEIGRQAMDGLALGVTDGMAAPMAAVADATRGVGDAIADMAERANVSFERVGGWLAQLAKGTTSVREGLGGVLQGLAGQWRGAGMDLLGQGLTGLLGPVGGGLATGFADNLMAFANGGAFDVGGIGGVDSQLVAFRATPGEHVEITPPGRMGADRGGMVRVIVGVDGSGNLQPVIRQVAGEVVAEAAPALVRESVGAVQRGMVRSKRGFG